MADNGAQAGVVGDIQTGDIKLDFLNNLGAGMGASHSSATGGYGIFGGASIGGLGSSSSGKIVIIAGAVVALFLISRLVKKAK